MYALNVDKNSRVLSATFEIYAPEDWPRIETLPEGNITDYKYKGGKCVYEPPQIPEKPPETPSQMEMLEKRVADLEKAAAER